MITLAEKKEYNLVGINTINTINKKPSDYCRALARRERVELHEPAYCNNINVKNQVLADTNKKAANTLLMSLTNRNKL